MKDALKKMALGESAVPHDYMGPNATMSPFELERHHKLNAAPSKEESAEIHHKANLYHAHLHDSDHALGKAQLHVHNPSLEGHYTHKYKNSIHHAYEIGHDLEHNHGVTARELGALHFHHRHKTPGEFADATVNHVHSKRKG